MEDIRLKRRAWRFADREWELCCNMNVIADVQGIYGDLGSALSGENIMRSVLDFLACMMNDWADTQGWQVRYTGRELGRILDWPTFNEVQAIVMELVTSAISPADGEDNPEEDPGKN